MSRPPIRELSVGDRMLLAPYVWPEPVVVCGVGRAAAATAAEALERAIASVIAELGDRIAPPGDRAIVVGSDSAARAETLRFAAEIAAVGPALANPALFPSTVMNAPAGIAAITHHCEGPNVTMSNGATSALDALVHAADLVAAGRARIAFAGGFETRIDADAAQDPDDPPAFAMVAAVMTANAALAAAAPLRARLLATASGAFDLVDQAAVAAALGGAASRALSEAPGISDAGGAMQSIVTSQPLDGLLAIADTLARIASPPSPVRASLFAISKGAAAGTVLLIADGVHS